MAEQVNSTGWASLFRAAFERAKNPMALLDRNRVIVAVNPALTAAYGYKREETVGRHGDIFLTPNDWKRAEAEWTEVLHRRQTLHARELVRGDGRRVRVQAAAYPASVAGHQLVLFVVIDEELKPARSARSASGERRTLSRRELDVVSRVALGQRAHEIAEDLVIAPTTVQTHMRNAMAKVGARSQAQLVAIAIAEGQLDPGFVNPEKSG